LSPKILFSLNVKRLFGCWPLLAVQAVAPLKDVAEKKAGITVV
jgi:hypothetical protein